MDSLIETLNGWGGTFSSFAWPMLWQSSLLIAILFALDMVLRRKLRASIRYTLWLVVLVKLCVPPTFALPTSPAWWLHKPPPPPIMAKPKLQNYTVTYDQGPLLELPPAPLPVYEPPKPTMSKLAWLLVISVSGSAAFLFWMLVRWWQIARLVRRAAASTRLTALVEKARRSIGMKRSVPVKLTPNAMSPAVCGLFRPVILMPQSLAAEFSDEQLRVVLLHELFHLRRRDVWLNFLQTLLQIAYWWHPLVWVANARIRRLREEAVDDAVMLALRDESETYAPTLLEVAKLALNRPLATLGLVGILESRSALGQRIERLMDFHPPRKAGLTLVSLLGVLAFTAVAVPMGEGPAPQPTNPVISQASTEILASVTNVTVGTVSNILTDPNFRVVVQALEQRSGVEFLKEPEVVTRSGRGVNSITMPSISAPLYQTNTERLVQEGKLHFEMGNFEAAKARMKQVLLVDSNNATAKYYLGLVQTNEAGAKNFTYTGLGRQGIVKRLHEIRLDRVEFHAATLGDVLRYLSQQTRTNDPEKKGINFLINLTPDVSATPAGSASTDIKDFSVTIAPPLTNVSLGDVLDAVVRGASEPIHYSIQDFAVVFSLKVAEPPQLFTRVFKVDINTLVPVLKQAGVRIGDGTDSSAQILAIFRRYVSGLGVDWETPPGKTIFYSDGKERLMVKATESDLNVVEHTIDKLMPPPPQIHIKARFVEVPKTGNGGLYLGGIAAGGVVKLHVSSWQSIGGITNASIATGALPGLMCVLKDEEFKAALNALLSRTDVKYLAEPEVTTVSGRQTQLRATQIQNLDPDYGKGLAISGPASLESPPDLVETGPVLEVIPSVLSDGYVINLGTTLAVTELIGSIRSTNTLPSNSNARGRDHSPKFVVKLRNWQVAGNLNLWDGQTVAIGGLPVANLVSNGKLFENSMTNREMVVFITATIVDPAGNRVHKDDEMPNAQKGIPPQPVAK